MTRILILLGLFLFTCRHSQAQDENFSKVLRKQVKETVSTLKLDKKQARKVSPIEKEYLVNLEQIHPLVETDPELYFRKRQAIRSVSEGAIYRLLNAEQRKTMAVIRKKRQQRQREIFASYDKKGGAGKESLFLALSDLY